MPCAHCEHCTADPVLRLPESPAPADPRYDAAVLAAYRAATERTRQPVRLLLQVNPWLSRTRLHHQLERARARGADTTGGVDPDAVQALLDHPGTGYLIRAGQFPQPEQVVLWELAEDETDARELVAAARARHAST